MTTQLYNVYKAARGPAAERQFFMQCPLETIAELLPVHRTAVERVRDELAKGLPVAELFFSRGRYTDCVFYVAKSYETDE